MSAVVKKEYTLGPGGLVSRGGVICRPGQSLWLTDAEYATADKSRLTLVSAEGKVVRDESTPKTQAAAAPQATVAAPTPMPATAPVTIAPSTPVTSAPVRDWDDFVANATAESLITYMQDSTVDEIKALRDAEKARGRVKRLKVISSANAALRRLNMAKARAVREAKMAAQREVETTAATLAEPAIESEATE